jgi:hypothetical protein
VEGRAGPSLSRWWPGDGLTRARAAQPSPKSCVRAQQRSRGSGTARGRPSAAQEPGSRRIADLTLRPRVSDTSAVPSPAGPPRQHELTTMPRLRRDRVRGVLMQPLVGRRCGLQRLLKDRLHAVPRLRRWRHSSTAASPCAAAQVRRDWRSVSLYHYGETRADGRCIQHHRLECSH